MEKARQHIEEIRNNKFLIGQQLSNPLTLDLHNAVINLSAGLYTKDVHFLMELIQNAEDNEYSEGIEPALEFVLIYRDICGLGAPATLLIFNNEVGFSKENIESLCSVGRSTKKCQRQKGFIGEKGIGFKSVFLATAQPHIISNGYQIKFNESPNKDCGMGYIVPEWVTSKPSVSDIQNIYGSDKILPATTIILPLKNSKLAVVKKHLSEIHPELLLFLQKIKRLSVRENNSKSVSDSISAISISSEINVVSPQTRGVDSCIVHLAVQENANMPEATCRYFIYKKNYHVDTKHRVDARKNVKELTISLAFPFGDRLSRGSSSVGIFAFLPTAVITNFPFIMQADFILTSSREAIVLHNKWNLGIIDHVPSCFLRALMTIIESPQMAELLPIPRVFEYLPLNESPVKQLNVIRESIRLEVISKCVVPCESLSSEKIILCKPTEVVRSPPEFKKILSSIKELIPPANIKTSEAMFFLHNSVDISKYDRLWNFLGVPSVVASLEKHLELIQINDILFRAPPKLYADILFFISNNWSYGPIPDNLINMRLLKYNKGNFESETERSYVLAELKKRKRLCFSIKVCYVDQVQHHSWAKKCNLVMGSPENKYFLTDSIVTAIAEHEKKETIKNWLRFHGYVLETTVPSYCDELSRIVGENEDPKLAVYLAHFIYHSTMKFPSLMGNVSGTLQLMPVIEESGKVSSCKKALVPASKSIWARLFEAKNDEEREEKEDEGEEREEEGDEWYDMYVELGDVYLKASKYAGENTPENDLLKFLIKHGKAIDLPDMFPRDKPIRIASCKLESDQAFLLLEWIRALRAKEGRPHPLNWTKYKIPERFLESIKCGKWMKTCSGFSSPTFCYLYDGIESANLLELGKAFNVVSAIDEEYYEGKIKLFRDELMFIGVQFGTENMYELIVDQVKAQVSSSEMSALLGISLLRFIRYSNNNKKLDVELLNILNESKWMKTSQGYVSPLEAVYQASGSGESILQITDLNIVDNAYYGSELNKFVHELEFLGVKTNEGDVYNLISDHLKFPEDLSKLTMEAVMLLLKCIRKLGSGATYLREKITTQPWIKTTLGYKFPSESLLLDPSWSCISNIVPLPLIDTTYYGLRIRTYKAELEAIGVAVNLDQAFNMLILKIKVLVSSCELTPGAVILLLDCMKRLKTKMPLQLLHLSYLSDENWLKTCHGYKSALDCILSDLKWKSVSVFIDLPFIDEGFYGNNIFSFKDELKMLGVVVDFSEGAHIIAKGLEFPDDQLSITADSIKSLLHCAQSLRHSTKSSDHSLLEQLVNKLRGFKWLKTHMGYRIPEESLIFKSKWNSYLEEQDGPFIDLNFYGIFSSIEIEELRAVGVKADTDEVCTSIFHTLPFHDNSPVILRVYRFLHKNKWSLNFKGNCSSRLWLPDQQGVGGKWVTKSECVLHDRDNLFGFLLHILDKYYDQELLSFMSMNFGVDAFPTVHKCVDLWDSWAKHNHSLSFLELHSFWQYISENWKTFIENNLEKSIKVLPATTILGTVELVGRGELFIPDDLELKEAFSEVSESPLFVWFPQNGSSSLTNLYQIYMSLGVRKISKCVQLSVSCKFEKIILKDSLMEKPLIKIILAYLANPAVNMMVEERHRISKYILDIPIFGTDSSMLVDCFLNLPISKKTINIQVRKLVLWEKNLKRMLVHKPSLKYKEIHKDMEFVSEFAKAISEAVLLNTSDRGDDLCKIIKMGFMCGFKEDDVDLLLMSENLKLSPLDSAFLECLFNVTNASPSASGKRKFLGSDSSNARKGPL